MKEYTKSLHDELEGQLQFIRVETEQAIVTAELAVNVTLAIVEKLKKFIIKYKFRNDAEEIHFFKHEKPKFISKLVYYNKVLKIETHRPRGGTEVVREYLYFELKKLKQFFDANLDFYRYYRTNSTYLDHKYFIRNKHDIKLCPDVFYFEADRRFSTSHDFKISKVIANDQVQIYLEEQLARLDQKDNKAEVLPKSSVYWTGSKVSLIELMYALHAEGSLNNGNIELNVIADFFQKTFNIDIGQYHRSFLEIRSRKTGRTKYLDSLKDVLQQRMDQADDHL